MSSLADVFNVLNRIRDEGVLRDYAIGGATAVLFYAEPARTYDVDVFVLLKSSEADGLTPLAEIYEWARKQGFTLDAEHVLVHGVPVQFLPAYNSLVEEAILQARPLSYGGAAVRVASPEHLVALALQAGGGRRRERAWLLLESGQVDRVKLRDVLDRYGIKSPDDL